MTPPLAVPTYALYVGIDLAATTFTAAWLRPAHPVSPAVTFPQSPAGFTALQQQLHASGAVPATTCVVLEATSS
jgi:hypothetical protein